MEREKVIFLCTGNSCRSQMAEGFIRHLAGDRLDAYSAGLEPRDLHPLAVTVMAERGIDISGQRSKSIEIFLGRETFHRRGRKDQPEHLVGVEGDPSADAGWRYPGRETDRMCGGWAARPE